MLDFGLVGIVTVNEILLLIIQFNSNMAHNLSFVFFHLPFAIVVAVAVVESIVAKNLAVVAFEIGLVAVLAFAFAVAVAVNVVAVTDYVDCLNCAMMHCSMVIEQMNQYYLMHVTGHHVFVVLHVSLLAYVLEMLANMDDFLLEMVNLNMRRIKNFVEINMNVNINLGNPLKWFLTKKKMRRNNRQILTNIAALR